MSKFLSVDPLADEMLGWSPYNYTMNNPINMIDPDGRAPEWPIYGKNKKIIGWVVEQGEGPTQIAQKLNDYYDCQLSCSADWKQIVYDNRPNFEKVFNEDGTIENKYSGEYKSGTIDPGDVLEITFGRENSEMVQIDNQLQVLIPFNDSVNKELNKTLESMKNLDGQSGQHPTDPGSGNTGFNWGKGLLSFFGYEGTRTEQVKQVNESQKKIDSLNNVKKEIED